MLNKKFFKKKYFWISLYHLPVVCNLCIEMITSKPILRILSFLAFSSMASHVCTKSIEVVHVDKHLYKYSSIIITTLCNQRHSLTDFSSEYIGLP